jgi:hypothetical protein
MINRKLFILLQYLYLQGIFLSIAQTAPLPTPPEVWKDYDPDKGDFKEEVVRQETNDGNLYKDSYISAYMNGRRGSCVLQVCSQGGSEKSTWTFECSWMDGWSRNRYEIRE